MAETSDHDGRNVHESSSQGSAKNRVVDAREVGANVGLHEPGMTAVLTLRPLYGGQTPPSRATGVRVVDQAPLEHGLHDAHQRVMDHPVAEHRGVDGPGLRIMNAESPEPAQPKLSRADLVPELRELDVEPSAKRPDLGT